MSLPNHLVIFVKAPRLGAVKTRLARDVGAVAAWKFYKDTVAALVRRLSRDPRWRTWIALAPDSAGREPGRWPRDVTLIPQGRGDLGERMDRALRRPPPGPVVLVGGDIPDIEPRHVAAAFRALGNGDAVFGPAADGGYWLVGLRRRPRTPRLFRDVRWSGPHALADTLADMPQGTRVAAVDTLEDIDGGVSFMRWRSRQAALRRNFSPKA